MRQLLPLVLAALLILVLKIGNLSIRLSDSNIYFYTASQILEGKLLYKDIFFTNFPVLIYASALYYLLLGKQLLLYYITPTLEVIGVSILVYVVVYQKTKEYLISVTSSFLYLFSFLVLSTSDHQTGVFLASLFATGGFFLFEKKRYIATGILLAFCFLTKAYFLPIIFSFFLYIIFQKKIKEQALLFAGFFVTAFIVLLPTMLFSFQDFIKQVFLYSLSRSQGIPKAEIIWFFILHDFLLFFLLLFNFFNYKKSLFFSIISATSTIFFFLYKDIYYLYLNFLAPFLCISLYLFYDFLKEHMRLQRLVLPTIIGCLLIVNLAIYLSSYKDLQKIQDVDLLVSAIQKEKAEIVYGVNDITPALAYLTNTNMLNNVIDTNANIFRKGLLDKAALTKAAISQKAIIVAHGAYYPQVGIDEKIVDEIFEAKTILSSCQLIQSTPIYAEGVANRLNLFSCKR